MPMNRLRKEQAIAKTARQAEIASFLLGGYRDQASLAQRFNVSQATISKDINAIEQAWRERIVADVNKAKALDLERLETAIGAVWPRVLAGNLDAIRTFIDLLKRKAAMLGYDAPKVIDLRTAVEREIRKAAIEYGLDEVEILAEANRILAGETV